MILVIQDGKITEKGTHQELMQLKGYYYKLFTNQFVEEKMKELNFCKKERGASYSNMRGCYNIVYRAAR